MQINKRYDPKEIEPKWYEHWENTGYFHSSVDEREPFTIVIPPPNVTGILHMGHMLNNTIQDVLIRNARLEGKNACWVPGTDHASIATEAKVVRLLREKGIKKSDLTREAFLDHAWQWKEKYGGKILEQLRKLGASCDWDRTAFTMDDTRSKAVIKVFVDLFNTGKLYRGLRMINWDPQAKTVLSNEEVLYNDEQSDLFYLKYKIEGTNDNIVVATQRPETIMGDTAVAVHPEDDRFKDLKGKNAIIPLINKSIPIIFDEYVDREFGTGALKITPAHDPNDYEIGLRHNLEVVDTINDDGSLNEKAQILVGLDRFEARKQIKPMLEQAGALQKTEEYITSIGRSERTNAVVEPKLSLQWYVDMKALATPALKAVMTDEIKFFPRKYKNVYRHWMENIRDWCISRQLWWGHRIPAWYKDGETFVAETIEEALQQAQEKFEDTRITIDDLRQDEDVLDTWFSSWLWPISVFDGFENEEELNYYYPTSVLVTGWDIIFLWVARMIMSGYEWKQERPFDSVYFTGMVRDKKGRRMSKSLGNSPDPLDLMDHYGADGVRYGMLSCSPAGGDLLFDEKLCETGRNFCNKIWNALRLVKSFEANDATILSSSQELTVNWFQHKMNKALKEIRKDFASYKLSEALVALYRLIWNDFCSLYLEMIKPKEGKSLPKPLLAATIEIFEKLMTMLHPFMPFITEEVWHYLKERKLGEDCIVSSYSAEGVYDESLIVNIRTIQDLIKNLRDLRNKNGIGMKEEIILFAEPSEVAEHLFEITGTKELVMKMANLSVFEVEHQESESPNQIFFLSGNQKYCAVIEKEIDAEAEKERLEKELEYAKGFLRTVEKKLSNERFVNNAPAVVVEKERSKLEDGKKRIKILEENLAKLNGR